jgi:dimethylargininase
MLVAFTRKPGPELAACELEFLPRRSIDIDKAIEQHQTYEACLAELGAEVTSLPADHSMPDGVFIEDPAVVVEEAAVITRMSAPSRRREHSSVAQALAPYRELHWLSEPAKLEGGDVLRIDKTVYVGVSRRTNREGISQLSEALRRFGYKVRPVEVSGCLHLKTACCDLGDGMVLANRAWFDVAEFTGKNILDVPEQEPWGANVIAIGGTVIASAASPRTCELLDRMGYTVRTLDISELLKAEAGLTCMSLLFRSE